MEDAMNAVAAYFKEAAEYGLEIEIMAEALLAMKEDPSLSVWDALDIGASEWLK